MRMVGLCIGIVVAGASIATWSRGQEASCGLSKDAHSYRESHEAEFLAWRSSVSKRASDEKLTIPDQVLDSQFDIQEGEPPRKTKRLVRDLKTGMVEVDLPTSYLVPFGYTGGCLQLRGSQSLELEWTDVPNWISRPYSISCIAKIYDGMENAFCELVTVTSGPQSFCSLSIENRRLRWIVATDKGQCSLVASTLITPMTWYRITATYDGTESTDGMKLFVEFQEARTKSEKLVERPKRSDLGSNPGQIRFRTSNVRDGARVFSLDSLRLYGRALTRIEAATIPDGRTLDAFLRHNDLDEDETQLLRDFYFEAIDQNYRSFIAGNEHGR